jgi:hypothetical protein
MAIRGLNGLLRNRNQVLASTSILFPCFLLPVRTELLAQAGRYRMKTGVAAILWEGDKRLAMSLPAGSIVTVQLSGEELPSGLVEATCDGKHFIVFAVDLRERGERVKVRDVRTRP